MNNSIPLKIGNVVEITSINKALKSIHITLHLTGDLSTIDPAELQGEMMPYVNNAMKYLISEGFINIDDTNGWLTHVGTILHSI